MHAAVLLHLRQQILLLLGEVAVDLDIPALGEVALMQIDDDAGELGQDLLVMMGLGVGEEVAVVGVLDADLLANRVAVAETHI